MNREAAQDVRALAFDIGGTVFDWHSTVRDEVLALATQRGVSVDAPAFANAWRRRQFEVLARAKSHGRPDGNADDFYRIALDEILPDFPALELSEPERTRFTRVWHRLRAWPDAPEAIEALRSRYMVVVLTVFSWSISVDISKGAGISWDGILSCEFLDGYKPDAAAYRSAARFLRLRPSQVMMVAAHPTDLRAAMAAGFRSAYVPRPGERGAGNDGDLSPQPDFDVNALDFPDLAKQLLGAPVPTR